MVAYLTLSLVWLDVIFETTKTLLIAALTVEEYEEEFWVNFLTFLVSAFNAFLSALQDVDEIGVAMYSGKYLDRLTEKLDQFRVGQYRYETDDEVWERVKKFL